MVGTFGPPPVSHRYSAVEDYWIGWGCILFFTVCGAAWIRRLIRGGEILRIGSDGILTLPWSDKTIPWTEIIGVTNWQLRNQRFIMLRLRDPKLFPGNGIRRWTSITNRALAGGDVSISLTATDSSVDEALSAINRFRPVTASTTA